MITLISRQSVFDKYSKITEEISEIQRLFYDDNPEYFANEQDRTEYQTSFDAKNMFFGKSKKFYSIVSFAHYEIKTFPNTLSHKLITLLSELGIKDLVMIAHFKMNFVGNMEHTYPPLFTAFKKFENITRDINYDEAFEFG
ncbi:hypothetical protein ABIB40_001135 [Pedobacter sp. UYP30]|uniref:hypothetical protein n=1 Tax=Pedobacter sp. UYP30 TaxID=1756400 RepID=UPI00339A4ECE